MPVLLRRLLPLLLASLLLASVAPAVAARDLSVAQAERRVINLLNGQRSRLGVVTVRLDTRLRDVARARSRDMVRRNYFSHQPPSGPNALEAMVRRGITWYRMGEIIAFNYRGTLRESAERVAAQWRESRAHYTVAMRRSYNYIAVGLSVDADGRKVWTGLLLQGPDRTGGWARMAGTRTSGFATASTSVGATLRWYGADIRLSTLTAGLRDFRVQRRIDGGRWVTIVRSTARRTLAVRLLRGHRYTYRVAARDLRGNVGRWSRSITLAP